jgi:hypothetical protein
MLEWWRAFLAQIFLKSFFFKFRGFGGKNGLKRMIIVRRHFRRVGIIIFIVFFIEFFQIDAEALLEYFIVENNG